MKNGIAMKSIRFCPPTLNLNFMASVNWAGTRRNHGQVENFSQAPTINFYCDLFSFNIINTVFIKILTPSQDVQQWLAGNQEYRC